MSEKSEVSVNFGRGVRCSSNDICKVCSKCNMCVCMSELCAILMSDCLELSVVCHTRRKFSSVETVIAMLSHVESSLYLYISTNACVVFVI